MNDQNPSRIKSKWLVYRLNEEGKYECINHEAPFSTMAEAEMIAKAAEPWTKPFLRCYFDVPLDLWEKANE